MTWRGRAGMLEFVCEQAVGRKCGSLSILGVHGPHCDDDVPDFFNDLSTLLASREQKSRILSVGDWNIDELPACQNDPFADDHERQQHHLLRRLVRDGWSEANSVEVSVPDQVLSVPDSSYKMECSTSPISRIPSNAQDGRPGLLDYSIASSKTIQSMLISWKPHISDRAIV